MAGLSLEAPLRAGETVHILGHTTDLEQTVESIEIEHRGVDAAGVGDDVAIGVVGKVWEGDKVYRVTGTAD